MNRIPFREVQPGVYDFEWGTQTIRLLVVRNLPLTENNSILHLFSANENQVQYAAKQYTKQSKETSSILDKLLLQYGQEGMKMPYTIHDFKMDLAKELLAQPETQELLLADLSPEERIKGIDPGVFLDRMDPKLRLEGLDPKQRLEGLDPKQRLEGLDPKQRLEGLDPTVIQQYLDEILGRKPKTDQDT
jgi:hypothetical protein